MLQATHRLAGIIALSVLALSASAEQWAPVVEPGQGYQDQPPTSPTTNQGLFNLLNQVESLQREVRALRGEIEDQGHRLQQLEKRHQEISGDLDRRLQTLESAGGKPPAGQDAAALPSPAPAAATAAMAPPAQAPPAESLPATGADIELSPNAPEAEKQTYQQAFGLLKAGQYDNAIAGFIGFLGQYPDSAYADNAQYWVGEAYYVTRKFDSAIMEYSKLMQAYPDSPKLPHALLKIAYSCDELGQKAEAKAKLQELIKSYPGTTAAKLAEERLQRLALP
ncbi:MAG: tol-pal system protein YbgF [Gammaproteobacteria bacterium]